MNHLYYGDNLAVLRNHITDDSVDLIYLDPPFNSDASYNVLFRSPTGEQSAAQIEAFDDTWHWGDEAQAAFQSVRTSDHTDAATMLEAMRSFLGTNDMMAYLAMMAVRLIELHRVLKPAGSLYLHCDPTASHYLKILLDAVFGAENFRNEIIWCYAGGGIPRKDFPRKHDVILRVTKSKDYTYNPIYRPYSEGTLQRGRTKVKGKYFEEGLNEEGTPVNDWWPDVKKITSPTDPEKLGYPTQKSLALLERIIVASSNPGDVVLDPFCGCGTTVHAAQKLGRRWIGIDVTHLAIGLIERRLNEAFPSIEYKVHGTPQDLAAAHDLFARDDTTKKEFEKWAVSLIGAQPWRGGKKGADGGIDGRLPFGKTNVALVSVKGGKDRQRNHIDQLRAVIDREKADIGVFLTLHEPTGPMKAEAAGAGQFQIDGLEPVPRIQIVTIEQAMKLRERAVKIPLARADTFRKPGREEDTSRQSRLDL